MSNHPITADPAPTLPSNEVLSEESRWAEELTYAILTHYGFTAEDIAEVESVHPGRVCDEECWNEDGDSVHGPAYDELGATASTVVEVVLPWVSNLLAAKLADRAHGQSPTPSLEA